MVSELKQILSQASKILAKSKHIRPNYESKLIMSKLINRDLLEIFVNSDLKITESEKKIFFRNIFKTFVKNFWFQRVLLK